MNPSDELPIHIMTLNSAFRRNARQAWTDGDSEASKASKTGGVDNIREQKWQVGGLGAVLGGL